MAKNLYLSYCLLFTNVQCVVLQPAVFNFAINCVNFYQILFLLILFFIYLPEICINFIFFIFLFQPVKKVIKLRTIVIAKRHKQVVFKSICKLK